MAVRGQALLNRRDRLEAAKRKRKCMDARTLKIEAAREALAHVEDGMRLGIGTGSTAEEFVRLLAEKVAGGMSVVGVPTSERTAALCRELGVPLSTLDETPQLDLTIDGADEIDPALSLIKGGGGALLREKIVAAASKRMLVIADATKLVDVLGRFPLPIEVNPFGLRATELAIREAAGRLGLAGPLTMRMTGDEPFVTDGGHFILDASFGRIPDTRALSDALHAIPGVVEHGLFLGLADAAIVADAEGVRILRRPSSRSS
jgi:ribose 5-phosphate isomerase A